MREGEEWVKKRGISSLRILGSVESHQPGSMEVVF